MAVVCMKKWGWVRELSQMQTQVAFATGASRGCTKVLVLVWGDGRGVRGWRRCWVLKEVLGGGGGEEGLEEVTGN